MTLNLPYEEDFFQRIVNVNWGSVGAIFATGNFPGVSYCKVASKTSKPIFSNIGGLGFSDLGITTSSSYAAVGADKASGRKGRPTFLVGGITDASEEAATGLIYASHDGLSWENVFSGLNLVIDGLVWDKKAQSFFANGFDTTIGDAPICHASADGYGWAPGGGDFLAHCEHGLPDGQFGYDEKNKLFKSAAMLDANAVAFAGGVWAKAQAETFTGGLPINRVLQVSFDGTKTWTAAGTIPDEESQIVTICGGPLTDFAKAAPKPGA